MESDNTDQRGPLERDLDDAIRLIEEHGDTVHSLEIIKHVRRKLSMRRKGY